MVALATADQRASKVIIVGQQPAGNDPFEGLPPELRALIEQLGSTSGMPATGDAAANLASLFAAMRHPPSGPVDWALAQKVAAQVAAEDDRGPTDQEVGRLSDAFGLAELWLDDGELPAPSEGTTTAVWSRSQWAAHALVALRPLVEPVAEASATALTALAAQQFEGMDEHDRAAQFAQLEELGIQLPPQVAELFDRLAGGDIGQMLRPASAALAGLQAGQVAGRLAQQMLGQYDLGIPTAPTGQATFVAVNITEAFDGYDLDLYEVAVVLALHEAAHRRLYHALGWLEPHVRSLVAAFAQGVEVDRERLEGLASQALADVDPNDPNQLRDAMERAANFRMEPTDAQRRVLARLQTVVCLVGAWARHETAAAARGRLPSIDRIHEVLRRRRAAYGDGETLLQALLGLDLKPADEIVGDRFVTDVIETLGAEGLRLALAHPENLPDAEELAEPSRWLIRTAVASEIPDDAAALFDEAFNDAPQEGSVTNRDGQSSQAPDDDSGDDAGDGDDD